MSFLGMNPLVFVAIAHILFFGAALFALPWVNQLADHEVQRELEEQAAAENVAASESPLEAAARLQRVASAPFVPEGELEVEHPLAS